MPQPVPMMPRTRTRTERNKERRKLQKTFKRDLFKGMEDALDDTIPLPICDIDEIESPDDKEPLQVDNTALDMVQIVLSNSGTPQTDSNTTCTSTSTVPIVIQDSVGITTDQPQLEGDDLIKYLKQENKELLKKVEFYHKKCEMLEKQVTDYVTEVERVRQFYRKLFHYGTKHIKMSTKK